MPPPSRDRDATRAPDEAEHRGASPPASNDGPPASNDGPLASNDGPLDSNVGPPASNVDPLAVLVFVALFASGVAGIVNQVIWQRALKIFLGGSEALSSMVVVLVFMLGLGAGAGFMALRARRIAHPLRAFGRLELTLAFVNAGIAGLLTLDLAASVFAVQRVALDLGVPLRAVYATGALLLLLPPTALMGVTLPLASEVFQRQLGTRDTRTIAVIFFLNTAGAAVGAFAASFFLLPYYGQRAGLLAAVGCNVAAGAILLVGARGVSAAAAREPAPRASVLRLGFGSVRLEEQLGAVLGFLSLGYEIHLFRLMALAHEPLPYTFALTLCLFLLFWSAGVYAASLLRERIALDSVTAMALVLVVPWVFHLDRESLHFHVLGGALVYYLPCLLFGLLYGHLVSRSAESWGSDVGRFYAWNTAGSCLGIVFFTLVGYEIPHPLGAVLIALGLLFVSLTYAARARERWLLLEPGAARWASRLVAVTMGGVVLAGLGSRVSQGEEALVFWGRDGVIEVDRAGDVHIDGLWHASLSNGTDHIGRSYSWFMAVAAIMAHGDAPIERALVVGSGIGITAATLARIDGLEVDAYEINRGMERVMERFPARTLRVLANPRIRMIWQDARSGLALDSTRYDLIISAPLHLRQAGSSLLLSREYFELLRERLRDGGVVALYSFEGPRAQSLLVRNTVQAVFRYGETLLDGKVTVASDAPIEIRAELTDRRLRRTGDLYREVVAYQRASGRPIAESLDSPRLSWAPTGYVITDDHPLVEYPDVAERLLGTGREGGP